MSQINVYRTIEKIRNLDPRELACYCTENAEECSNEEMWRRLVAEVYPDIYKIAKRLSFPDWEKEQRSARRKFMPMRELYTQLLAITTDPSLLAILNTGLAGSAFEAQKTDMDQLRIYHQVVSFVLSHTSFQWRKFLAVNNDPVVQVMPLKPKELKKLMGSEECRSIRFLCRYYGEKRISGREDINEGIRESSRKGQTELLEFLLRLPPSDPGSGNNYAIRVAAQEGHLEIVRMLLSDSRVDPTALQCEVLALACGRGHGEVVKLLLADNRIKSTAGGGRALREASSRGHTEIVQILLANQCVNQITATSQGAALVLAARYGHIEILKQLISDNSTITQVDYNNAFWAAFDNDHIAIAKFLLEDSLASGDPPRIDPSQDSNKALRLASEKGYTEIIKLLLRYDCVDPTVMDNSPIEMAACYGRLQVVKLLLADERVSRLDRIKGNVIQFASRGGHVDIVKFLLTYPYIDPTAQDNSAIRLAAEHGRAEVVRLLLQDERVDPTDALQYAVRQGHAAVVELLLRDNRVDPSIGNNKAFHEACERNYDKVVKLLLQDGRIDPGADNAAALRKAAKRNSVAVVGLLLADLRVDPTAGNNAALLTAASHGRVEVVKSLLQHPRVDPAANESVAICKAAKKGHTAVVKCLLEDGRADPTANSYLALRLAVASDNIEIACRLVKDPRVNPNKEDD